MHFRILKTIATSGFLTALECTKFVSCHRPRWRNLQHSPRRFSWFKGVPFLRGRMRREGKGRGGKEGKIETALHRFLRFHHVRTPTGGFTEVERVVKASFSCKKADRSKGACGGNGTHRGNAQGFLGWHHCVFLMVSLSLVPVCLQIANYLRSSRLHCTDEIKPHRHQ